MAGASLLLEHPEAQAVPEAMAEPRCWLDSSAERGEPVARAVLPAALARSVSRLAP